jgi:hypothetical protein
MPKRGAQYARASQLRRGANESHAANKKFAVNNGAVRHAKDSKPGPSIAWLERCQCIEFPWLKSKHLSSDDKLCKQLMRAHDVFDLDYLHPLFS